MENVKLNTIEEAIEDFKAGNFVYVINDNLTTTIQFVYFREICFY